MKTNPSTPLPKTRVDVFRRALHLLALIQNPFNNEEWNSTRLADIISLDPSEEEGLSKKNIDSAKELLRSMGFSIPPHGGGRSIPFDPELSDTEAGALLFSYLPMVVRQLTVEDLIKSSFEVNPGRLLYILSRIYFAAIEKKVISLSYRSTRNSEAAAYTLHPWFWVYREESIYLTAFNEARARTEIFRITRIESFTVLDRKFQENIPDPGDIFSNSGGIFIGPDLYKITLSAAPVDRNLISENFGHLDCSFAEEENEIRCGFLIHDLIWLCQRLLPLNGRVKLLGDNTALEKCREIMKQALKDIFVTGSES